MKRPRFTVYQARDGYRWRLLAANNRLIAESGEAYTREWDAWRATETVEEAVLQTKRRGRNGLRMVRGAGSTDQAAHRQGRTN